MYILGIVCIHCTVKREGSVRNHLWVLTSFTGRQLRYVYLSSEGVSPIHSRRVEGARDGLYISLQRVITQHSPPGSCLTSSRWPSAPSDRALVWFVSCAAFSRMLRLVLVVLVFPVTGVVVGGESHWEGARLAYLAYSFPAPFWTFPCARLPSILLDTQWPEDTD